MDTVAVRERALAIHKQALVIDGLDGSVPSESHFRRMKQGGITAANITVVHPWLNFRQTVEGIRDLDLLIDQHSDLVVRILVVDDITAAKSSGRVGIIYGLQNALPIEGDIRLAKVFYDLGIRIIQLAYSTANLIADGCMEPRNGGLTVFGRALVGELNRLGILIDLSHVGERATLDIIAASAAPAAVTHSCAKALIDHPRNKSDEVIRTLVARGGVMGIAVYPDFLCDYAHGELPTLEHYLNHIDYVANLVGIDHVGLGTDFMEGLAPNYSVTPTWGGSKTQADATPRAVWPLPLAVSDASRLSDVTEGLLARGYSEDAIRNVLGGNWLGLLRQVWAR